MSSDNLPKGWKKVKLGEIAEILMGQSPSSKFYNNGGIGLPFLQGNRTFGYRYPEIDTYCSNPLKVANKGDILFSVRAPVGEINIAHTTVCIGRGLAALKAKNGNNTFLFYLLHYLKNEILNAESGTVFGSINKTDLSNLEACIPFLEEEQKAIASVLSSLDDKIDLLHRQNKTLEQMAETLFRQWFIEEAKEDWEEKPLDEIANYLNGLACQKYPPRNKADKLPVLKIKELRSGFTENSDWATSDVPSEYIVENGDVIFSWSGSLLVKIWDGGKCVLNQHLFKVTSKTYPKWFYYFWTKYYLEKFIAIAESKATTMGHIKRKDLSTSMVLVPSEDELEDMDNKISPLIEKIILINKQIRTLEQLRDILLPKLISGEVRVNH